MNSERLEINKLRVRKEYLLSQLKSDFNRFYKGAIHSDIIILVNLYCEHQCGIETEFSKRAFEIEEIDQLLEQKQKLVFWPKWRAAHSTMISLMQSGRINNEAQFEKAAIFLAKIEDILSLDKVNLQEIDDQQEKEIRSSKKLYFLAELLHPWIVEHAFEQYRSGHFRDAVLNAFIALGNLIRDKTGIQLDGAALATQALSVKEPRIILSELESESGRNEQIGFMHIIQGSFIGIRNPLVHSIHHDLTEDKAAQYLVLASLLAQKITDASVIGTLR
jgi:uncharacterized protein (TIGR02391 family)